jgi:hypothetical protein
MQIKAAKAADFRMSQYLRCLWMSPDGPSEAVGQFGEGSFVRPRDCGAIGDGAGDAPSRRWFRGHSAADDALASCADARAAARHSRVVRPAAPGPTDRGLVKATGSDAP